ncbi:MAG: hypothetical protein ACK5NT_11045 [Pyrinomonadaceae bacterium]
MDKNKQTLLEKVSSKGAKSLNVKTMSLVAGNVTGGGGTATTTKT